MKILVTGANGFIGYNLCKQLHLKNIKFIATVRNDKVRRDFKNYFVKEVNGETYWGDVLDGVDVVIHLAGIAHVTEKSNKNHENYDAVNVRGTKNLALQASAHGVKRFLFVSSIGVNGNISEIPLNEDMLPNPQELYAKSKKSAEDELKLIASNTKLEFVIIRPPLVYGKDVKANFRKLIELSKSKIPIPFANIENRRSLIYIENLIDFIILCINHPKAKNETFFTSDDEDVSTKQLIISLAESMNKKKLLLPVSEKFLKPIFSIVGKKYLYTKVYGSLYVDVTKAKSLLGWKPPFTFKQGIYKTMRDDCIE